MAVFHITHCPSRATFFNFQDFAMTIFTFDINSYYCSIMAVQEPFLKNRPFVISRKTAASRVLSASPMARQENIRRGDSLSVSIKKCPGLQVVPPDFQLFQCVSRAIMHILKSHSPRIEPGGNGRFMLDMSGMRALHPDLPDTARHLQKLIRESTCLRAHCGIAENKLVSTVAAGESQRRKKNLILVPKGSESRFLGPLPCRILPEWRYRPIQTMLHDLNLTLIQHIQSIPADLLCLAMGPLAVKLHEHASGIDHLPVTPPEQTEVLETSHQFTPPTNHQCVLLSELFNMVEKLGFTLRKRHAGADELRMFLRYRDGQIQRKTLKFTFCQNDLNLYRSAKQSFTGIYHRRQAVSHLALSLRGLAPFYEQLELFPSRSNRCNQLQKGLDSIRKRFGMSSIRYAIPG
jgi:DNA polymerase-4